MSNSRSYPIYQRILINLEWKKSLKHVKRDIETSDIYLLNLVKTIENIQNTAFYLRF